MQVANDRYHGSSIEQDYMELVTLTSKKKKNTCDKERVIAFSDLFNDSESNSQILLQDMTYNDDTRLNMEEENEY